MLTPMCSDCGASVPLPADAMQNELITCPDCGAELEIIALNPPTLELAPQVEEDWGE
ncbi:MAG: lysine biosynthesis protein LysW [Chloroflexota bacterium]|nr:lysine biosynthesis protein LysW [Chloroflexota bacterium]